MAVTLTSSQVTFSSYGPLEGVYQGTNSNNTVFPIGTYIVATPGCCCSTIMQSAKAPGVSGGYIIYYNPRTLLSGTWRCRGSGAYTALSQRVA